MFTATHALNPIVQQQIHEQAKSRMLVILFLIGLVLLLGPLSAHAQTQGTMPWETFTSTIAKQMCGPWVKWLAVIAVALGGIMFGLGELSGPFKRTMEIAGGFSIAVAAAAVVGMMLPGQNIGGACGV